MSAAAPRSPINRAAMATSRARGRARTAIRSTTGIGMAIATTAGITTTIAIDRVAGDADPARSARWWRTLLLAWSLILPIIGLIGRTGPKSESFLRNNVLSAFGYRKGSARHGDAV